MMVGFLNLFFKYQLTFFSAKWRFSAGRTGPAKAMVNNSGLGQIKKNLNKATICRVMGIYVENMWNSLENMNIQ